MNPQHQEELKKEISHIFESGANEIRIFEMVRNFIDKRYNEITPTESIEKVEYILENRIINPRFCNCENSQVHKINDRYICAICNKSIY